MNCYVRIGRLSIEIAKKMRIFLGAANAEILNSSKHASEAASGSLPRAIPRALKLECALEIPVVPYRWLI
jgi:hypothetical protein